MCFGGKMHTKNCEVERGKKNICITPSITLSLMYHASATVCHKSEFKATPVHISAEISLEAIPDDRKDHLD